MVPLNEDNTRCSAISPTCESYSEVHDSNNYLLSQDSTFTGVCNKIGHPKVLACPSGTTEWRTGYCYLDCPNVMIENGLSCLKRTSNRLQTNPLCRNWLFWYDGSECAPNPFIILILIGIFTAFVLIANRRKH